MFFKEIKITRYLLLFGLLFSPLSGMMPVAVDEDYWPVFVQRVMSNDSSLTGEEIHNVLTVAKAHPDLDYVEDVIRGSDFAMQLRKAYQERNKRGAATAARASAHMKHQDFMQLLRDQGTLDIHDYFPVFCYEIGTISLTDFTLLYDYLVTHHLLDFWGEKMQEVIDNDPIAQELCLSHGIRFYFNQAQEDSDNEEQNTAEHLAYLDYYKELAQRRDFVGLSYHDNNMPRDLFAMITTQAPYKSMRLQLDAFMYFEKLVAAQDFSAQAQVWLSLAQNQDLFETFHKMYRKEIVVKMLSMKIRALQESFQRIMTSRNSSMIRKYFISPEFQDARVLIEGGLIRCNIAADKYLLSLYEEAMDEMQIRNGTVPPTFATSLMRPVNPLPAAAPHGRGLDYNVLLDEIFAMKEAQQTTPKPEDAAKTNNLSCMEMVD